MAAKLSVSDRWQRLMRSTWYHILEETAQSYPEVEALVFRDQRITYREYLEKVKAVAKGLYALGIRRGDHVGLWMTNRPEWCFFRFAIYKLGAVMIPLNTRYKAADLEFVLRDSDCRMLIMETSFLGVVDAMGMLKSLCPEVDTDPRGHLKTEKFPFLRSVVCLGEDVPGGGYSLADLLVAGDTVSEEAVSVPLRPEDTTHIIYTSGTTGFPKGVMQPNTNFIALCAISAELHHLEPGDKYLASAPFFGNIGLWTQSISLIQGATVVITDRFDAQSFMELIDREKIKHTVFVPTMLIDILNHPDFAKYDLSSLSYAVVGGAVVPSKVIKEARERIGLEVMNAYGLSEASGLSTWVPAGDTAEHVEKTIGLPMPHCEVAILDPRTGEPVPDGQEGEICTRETIPGSQHMKGYYKRPDLTAETIRDRWLHSGDLGRKRPDGYFEITGRVKEMFVVGGFNVSPPEVEGVILSHPKVDNVAVVGVPDQRLGEVGAAFVRLLPGKGATPEEIINFCQERLAKYKVPRYVFFVEEFPLTAQGKVQKFKLREVAIKELGLAEK